MVKSIYKEICLNFTLRQKISKKKKNSLKISEKNLKQKTNNKKIKSTHIIMIDKKYSHWYTSGVIFQSLS